MAEGLAGERFVLRLEDDGYPDALRDLKRPPEALYCIGSREALAQGVSIVGSRRGTPYGCGCARRFAAICARKGVPVISGGAIGCDAAAHEGALQEGGRTLVVLGGGIDRLYPKANARLFQRIVDAGGALVSELAWDDPPRPYTFRERNRLIAALGRAVLVVEAGLPSGTFGTADDALELGRDVWAVPGAITSPHSAGANRLIQQGAFPVIDDRSIEQSLFSLFSTLVQEREGARELPLDDPLFLALCAQPCSLEELAVQQGPNGVARSVREVVILVSAWEAAGLVRRGPDGRFFADPERLG